MILGNCQRKAQSPSVNNEERTVEDKEFEQWWSSVGESQEEITRKALAWQSWKPRMTSGIRTAPMTHRRKAE